jgi:hypothetical protein
MSDYVDPDQQAPMEWLCEEFDLTFKWTPRGTNIEVGRYDPYTETGRIWDQCICVYDHATGQVTLERTYEAFRAKCEEWTDDMYREEEI